MDKNARNLVVAAILVFVAALVLCVSNTDKAHSGTKTTVTRSNSPIEIDAALRRITDDMPPVYAFRAKAYATDTGFALPYNYGDTSRYVAIAQYVSGTLTNALVITNIAGDSLRMAHNGSANHKVVNIIVFKRGLWGK